MSEREEALENISAIKNHLIDKQIFFPYNYNTIYVWSILVTILTFTMVPMYEKGILYGAGTIFILISIGFISEGFMTKKMNKNYDIEECTIKQKFIVRNFMMLSAFLVVLSSTLAVYKLYIPIYLSWLFLISIGYFAVGYLLNIKKFKKMAEFNAYLAVFLLGMGGYKEHLVGNETICFNFVQIAILFGLAILPAFIAWQQKKEF